MKNVIKEKMGLVLYMCMLAYKSRCMCVQVNASLMRSLRYLMFSKMIFLQQDLGSNRSQKKLHGVKSGNLIVAVVNKC